MPLYEYRCGTCGHEFETLQKMSDEPLVHCPACNEPSLRKLVSAAGFRLKGGGWYETDFKAGNKRNLADTGSATEKAKTADSEGGSATKKPKAAA